MKIPNYSMKKMWMQQDEAFSYYANDVRRYLDTFPNQWIGRRDSIEWSARFCDLTPILVELCKKQDIRYYTPQYERTGITNTYSNTRHYSRNNTYLFSAWILLSLKNISRRPRLTFSKLGLFLSWIIFISKFLVLF